MMWLGAVRSAPFHQVCWNPDAVLLHEASRLFQQIDGRLVIDLYTRTFQYFETGTVNQPALLIPSARGRTVPCRRPR